MTAAQARDRSGARIPRQASPQLVAAATFALLAISVSVLWAPTAFQIAYLVVLVAGLIAITVVAWRRRHSEPERPRHQKMLARSRPVVEAPQVVDLRPVEQHWPADPEDEDDDPDLIGLPDLMPGGRAESPTPRPTPSEQGEKPSATMESPVNTPETVAVSKVSSPGTAGSQQAPMTRRQFREMQRRAEEEQGG